MPNHLPDGGTYNHFGEGVEDGEGTIATAEARKSEDVRLSIAPPYHLRCPRRDQLCQQ